MTVRVRFAPSPTGEMHIGGLRSSLFDYLFARRHGGSFILRIEDTDRTRMTPGALDAILEAHRWLGLTWDEGPEAPGECGPYYQSERLARYQAAAARLVAQGDAYRCYCTTERLDTLRAAQMRAGRSPGYDRHCRALTAEQRAAAEQGSAPHVVRFAMPREGKTSFTDAIRGEITFDNARYDDHVLLKSDGFPTYHLAAILDDGEMRISHALRAEEWLPSTPRHLLTFRALGFEPPVYAHLPVVVGKDRKKLSKRHGDTSVQSFRDQGYLPEAMFNFLGLIGWSLDDHTVELSREQFIEHFDLDRVVKSPAMFDRDKLDWLNGQYIRRLPEERFVDLLMEWLEKGLPPAVPRPLDRDFVQALAPETQTRIKRLDEVAPLTGSLFITGRLAYDTALFLGKGGAGGPAVTHQWLAAIRALLEGHADWDWHNQLEPALRAAAAEHAIGFGRFITPLRIAATGSTTSLPMDVTLRLLGRERVLARIDDALARLAAVQVSPAIS